MTKTLIHNIFFFLHQNQNIFFSNVGNQNIFLEKNHNQSMPIITKVERSNPVHGQVYLIQQYVIKFVSDIQQVGGFLHQ